MKVTEETSDHNCDEWEAFAQISIAMLIQEELNIKVATKDIMGFNSFQNVLNYVNKHNK